MNVDLRGFRYSLEPLLRQRTWRLDACRAQLAQLQTKIDRASAALEVQRAEHLSQCALASSAAARMLDPAVRHHLLVWIGHSQSSLAQAEQALNALYDERREAASQCVEAERNVRVIEQHRSDALAQFVRDETARLGSEADRDWLARAGSAPALAFSEPDGSIGVEYGQ